MEPPADRPAIALCSLSAIVRYFLSIKGMQSCAIRSSTGLATGLAPISVLFEYVFGIRPEALKNRIVWHVNLTEAHGIRRYPFKGGTVTLLAGGRTCVSEMPEFTLESAVPVDVEIHVAGQTIIKHLEGSEK